MSHHSNLLIVMSLKVLWGNGQPSGPLFLILFTIHMPSTGRKQKSSVSLTRSISLPDSVQRQIFIDIKTPSLKNKTTVQIVSYQPEIYGDPKVLSDKKRIKAAINRIRFLRSKREKEHKKYVSKEDVQK